MYKKDNYVTVLRQSKIAVIVEIFFRFPINQNVLNKEYYVRITCNSQFPVLCKILCLFSIIALILSLANQKDVEKIEDLHLVNFNKQILLQ